jgi:hypothetical protein
VFQSTILEVILIRLPALSASTYISTCLEKFKRNPENLEMPPIIERETLMRENDHPELDESPVLDDQRATLY